MRHKTRTHQYGGMRTMEKATAKSTRIYCELFTPHCTESAYKSAHSHSLTCSQGRFVGESAVLFKKFLHITAAESGSSDPVIGN